MNPLIVIQARMSSKRLPGKVLMETGGGTLIDRIINSAQKSKLSKKFISLPQEINQTTLW